MEGQTFLTAAKTFLTTALSMGSDIMNWCVTTEPVNYFLAIGIVGGVVGLVYRIKRGQSIDYLLFRKEDHVKEIDYLFNSIDLDLNYCIEVLDELIKTIEKYNKFRITSEDFDKKWLYNEKQIL